MLARQPVGDARLQAEEQDHQRDQHHRKRRAEGPVVGGQELVVDEVADHLEAPAAEQRGREEIADREHEDEDRAGGDAGHRSAAA